jgi:hypothetical protein
MIYIMMKEVCDSFCHFAILLFFLNLYMFLFPLSYKFGNLLN